MNRHFLYTARFEITNTYDKDGGENGDDFSWFWGVDLQTKFFKTITINKA